MSGLEIANLAIGFGAGAAATVLGALGVRFVLRGKAPPGGSKLR